MRVGATVVHASLRRRQERAPPWPRSGCADRPTFAGVVRRTAAWSVAVCGESAARTGTRRAETSAAVLILGPRCQSARWGSRCTTSGACGCHRGTRRIAGLPKHCSPCIARATRCGPVLNAFSAHPRRREVLRAVAIDYTAAEQEHRHGNNTSRALARCFASRIPLRTAAVRAPRRSTAHSAFCCASVRPAVPISLFPPCLSSFSLLSLHLQPPAWSVRRRSLCRAKWNPSVPHLRSASSLGV